MCIHKVVLCVVSWGEGEGGSGPAIFSICVSSCYCLILLLTLDSDYLWPHSGFLCFVIVEKGGDRALLSFSLVILYAVVTVYLTFYVVVMYTVGIILITPL